MAIQGHGGMTVTTGVMITVIMPGTLIIDRVMIEETFSMAAITLDRADGTPINTIKIDIGSMTGTVMD